jgi:hypothetical protein
MITTRTEEPEEDVGRLIVGPSRGVGYHRLGKGNVPGEGPDARSGLTEGVLSQLSYEVVVSDKRPTGL